MEHTELVKKEIESTIEDFYTNNQSKLKKICNKEMLKFGGLSQKDYDCFYSRAGYELSIARETYDPSKGKSFMDYALGVIRLSVCKEMTYRNRKKRQLIVEKEETDENGKSVTKKEYISNISIDTPIGDDEGLTVGDTLQSNFNIDDVFGEETNEYSDKIENFMQKLSDIQKNIVNLIMKGYSSKDIKKLLNLSDNQYRDAWNIICSYDNKRILFNEKYDSEEYEMNETVVTEDVSETYKNTSYSIESISKQLKKKRIRDDHILQRHSGQWKAFAKSELISDILRGKSLTQIIISEEIKNGLKMQWLIDGKQRCTTLDDYLNDGFAISKNVKNYNIKYQAPKIDENGYEVLNGDGFTDMEWKVFDIRGKKFSQLPEELQDIFKDRQIPVLYNMNCTKKDIADDIARFNRSRPMNKAQNGWLGLDEDFAELVEKIAKMQFFQPEYYGSSYTSNSNTSGALRRIIVESIMVSDFMDEYCDFEKMCEFLTEEASDSNFTEFYAIVERLTTVSNKDVAKLFNVKDSFLWFGLFSRFINLNLDDHKFIDFMKEFNNTLHSKEIDGESFDNILIKTKSTKDKSVVEKKINLLENLMLDYLHITKTEEVVTKKIDILNFIKENINSKITQDDIEFHKDNLESWTVGIPEDSKIHDQRNKPSIIAIAAYVFENDNDCDDETMIEWFADYENRNKNYILNQKDNFLHMKNDLERFISNKNKEEKKSA